MKLLILGAGQYGAVAREVAEAMGCFERIEFLDDKNEIAVGKMADYERYMKVFDSAVVAIGNPALRLEWIGKLKRAGYQVTSLVHPRSYVSPSAELGEGCIVEPLAGVNANVVVGTGCLLSMGSVVNHNAAVGNGCHIDCNAVVAAREIVPEGTKVMSGTVFQKI